MATQWLTEPCVNALPIAPALYATCPMCQPCNNARFVIQDRRKLPFNVEARSRHQIIATAKEFAWSRVIRIGRRMPVA